MCPPSCRERRLGSHLRAEAAPWNVLLRRRKQAAGQEPEPLPLTSSGREASFWGSCGQTGPGTAWRLLWVRLGCPPEVSSEKLVPSVAVLGIGATCKGGAWEESWTARPLQGGLSVSWSPAGSLDTPLLPCAAICHAATQGGPNQWSHSASKTLNDLFFLKHPAGERCYSRTKWTKTVAWG